MVLSFWRSTACAILFIRKAALTNPGVTGTCILWFAAGAIVPYTKYFHKKSRPVLTRSVWMWENNRKRMRCCRAPAGKEKVWIHISVMTVRFTGWKNIGLWEEKETGCVFCWSETERGWSLPYRWTGVRTFPDWAFGGSIWDILRPAAMWRRPGMTIGETGF